jgi:hypothetical protein
VAGFVLQGRGWEDILLLCWGSCYLPQAFVQSLDLAASEMLALLVETNSQIQPDLQDLCDAIGCPGNEALLSGP